MFTRRFTNNLDKPVWTKVAFLSSILFLLTMADAVVSFWAPNLIQDSFQSSIIMGVIISVQSIFGLGADLVFPQLMKAPTVKKLLLFAILFSLLTTVFLSTSVLKPLIILFLLAMATWGLYYEFINFADQTFVSESVPTELRSGVWAIIGVFRSLAYFLGPLIAAILIIRGKFTISIFAISLLVLAFLVLTATGKTHTKPIKISLTKINLKEELGHWRILFGRVWPIVLLSMFMGFVDATFWTTGAIWTAKLAEENFLGSFFLPLYELPAIFMGAIVVKWGIYKGKKKMAEIFFLGSGVFLILLGLRTSIVWQLIMVFVSSLLLSITYPLVSGVYSDLTFRMGKMRGHMMGLTGSVANLSYIIWPIFAGILTRFFGERMTFTFVGFLVVLISVILIIVTPKKLMLPQEEIKKWK
jgi:MFS family permease